MTIAFFSIFLNHHQVFLADELYRLINSEFTFVELSSNIDNKGATTSYSSRPYLLKAWESGIAYSKAMSLAETADVCVFSGYESLPFERARMKKGLLSFEMSERLLKRGWFSLLSPRILKMVMNYHIGRWRNKPIYKLCMGAFAARDQYKLHSFLGKCYKWGYYSLIDEDFKLPLDNDEEIIPIMWCGRFLRLKHPELPILMAKRLKEKGLKFHLSIYGDDNNAAPFEKVYPRKRVESLITRLDVSDCVTLMGSLPNDGILKAMRSSDVFLFTSDRHEGWGVVSNESLANGCALVASDAIGSAPYLIEDGYNGFLFQNGNVDSLTEKVQWLLLHPKELRTMRFNAHERMLKVWSPQNAARSFLQLIESIKGGQSGTISVGPCSKA